MRSTLVCIVAAMVATAAPARLAEQDKSAIPQRLDDRTIVHVLNRLGFGAAPGDAERVRTMGLAGYIDRQLHPERIDDGNMSARLSSFSTLARSTEDIAREYYAPAQMARRDAMRRQAASQTSTEPAAAAASDTRKELREMMTPEQAEAVRMERQALSELVQAKILRAVYSERQLEEVMVDFWFNHFNVFSGKGRVRVYLNEYERDAIRPHVLGSFRELLQATAESPAMLFYLDNWQSAAAEGARTLDRRNRRAGLNENYARELMELHTLGVDGGYTQKDVQEVARAFTGWTIANPRQGGSFKFDPRMHDAGEKVVLGHRIKAGGGKKDGDQVLDVLASHPSTATFIATKLARRFVADDPPKPLVDRAAARFRETNGNIREVVRTIVTSPEFFSADAYRAKVKTPFEFVVSAVRSTGTEVTNAMPLVAAVRTLGMPLYGCQPPTGYSDRAEAWVNSGALLNRMNFAVSLTASRQGRGAVDRVRLLQGRTAGRPRVTSDGLVASSLAGEVSKSTATTIAKAETPSQAVALVLGSPEFQRR